MNTKKFSLISLVISGWLVSGCQGIEEESEIIVGEQRSALTTYSTSTFFNYIAGGKLILIFDFVGRELNGQSYNGTVLDGHGIMGVSLNDVVFQGAPMEEVTLKDTVFIGTTDKHRHVIGYGFKGAIFTAILDNGNPLSLRIDDINMNIRVGGIDTRYYNISYPTTEGWMPLCGVNDKGEAIPAIPLNGRWNYSVGEEGSGSWIDDPNAFTFACQEYVLAKCVEAGYKPWATGLVCSKGQGCQKISLAQYHQACTRLLRADYCGDGNSYTVDGMEIGMYDGLVLRKDRQNWLTEAEWDTDGARCLAHQRLADGPVPPCAEDLATEDCGDSSHFAEGTLLLSEIPPVQN